MDGVATVPSFVVVGTPQWRLYLDPWPSGQHVRETLCTGCTAYSDPRHISVPLVTQGHDTLPSVALSGAGFGLFASPTHLHHSNTESVYPFKSHYRGFN